MDGQHTLSSSHTLCAVAGAGQPMTPAADHAARRTAFACCFVLASWLLLAANAVAQMPRTVTADAKSPRRVADAARVRPSDRQDVLLMLDGGPVHVQLNLAIGGIALVEARRQFVTNLIETLDKDKDGKLSRSEAAGSPLFRKKERGGEFVKGLGAQATMTRKDVEIKIEAHGGGPIGFREDLTSSKNDIEVFKLLDADTSGTLDESELSAARELIVGKDTDDDDCVSFEEFFPPPAAPTDPIAAANAQLNAPPPPLASAIPQTMRSTSDPTLPRRLRIKYDRNKDLQLDAAELGWSAERIKELDTNLNGKLDEKELKGLPAATPDLDLAVDLKSKDKDGGVVAVDGTAGKRLDDAGRLDYAKVAFSGAIITFSMRNADPIASAIDDAMRQFNALDADANGYLDKDETSMRLRFQRELFDVLDADGDEKVFVDEMKAYVKAYAEPSATTCRMNLYDTGHGFFMALDANADGRVSIRERNQAASALAALERDGKPGVGQTEPVRHFHVEFVRGTRHLFGASEELVAQTPAFQQRLPTGPVWFQRMDRNNDGDLVWNEFFGHKETFHELDKDKDDLLDPQEAAAYPIPDSSDPPETGTTSASR